MRDKPADPEQRLLVLAPTQRDARLSCEILERTGIDCLPCTDLAELCTYLPQGAGGALLTEEAFGGKDSNLLLQFLADQPSWSDFPILFLSRGGADSPLARRAMEKLGNVLLLGRPLPTALLVSAARGVLRERRRQYLVRDQLQELERRRKALEENEQALLKAKKTAEEASRAKGQFLANMSHEIRTPLSVIVGTNELLSETVLSAHQRHCVQMAKTASESLLQVINDILDFSRIEAKKLVFKEDPFDLHACIDETLQLLAQKAREKELDLSLAYAPGTPQIVVGDPDRLRQVLFNLVGNALKFTKVGRISVSVEAIESAHPQSWCFAFAVQDTGIGIPREKIGGLFRPFSQVDESHSRQFGGTGLGLAICKEIVTRMGGKIGVESELGRGSTFRFTVVFGKAAEALMTRGRKDRLSAGGGIRRDTRILLAEDDPMIRELLLMMLAKDRWEIVTACDGKEAVERWRTGTFDAILMDVQMPLMTGLEATRLIRQEEEARGAHTPIIALTAHAMKEDMERCLEAGMDDYVSKPIQKSDLLEALNKSTQRATRPSSAHCPTF